MEITLNVFIFRTKEQIDQTEIGIEVPLSECDLEERTFYNIDYIAPDSNGKQYCCVSSGGDDFTVNQSYQEVKEMIRSARLSRFN